MNELKIFQYKNNSVRVVNINGEPWFVAKDLGRILGFSNIRVEVSRLDSDERMVSQIVTPSNSGYSNVVLVSEPGLYALIFRSRKPEARLFSRWVRHDVLPEVRATGSYNSEGSKQLKIKAIQTMLEASYISDETKAILGYELTKLITGGIFRLCFPKLMKDGTRPLGYVEIQIFLQRSSDCGLA